MDRPAGRTWKVLQGLAYGVFALHIVIALSEEWESGRQLSQFILLFAWFPVGTAVVSALGRPLPPRIAVFAFGFVSVLLGLIGTYLGWLFAAPVGLIWVVVSGLDVYDA